MKTPSAFGLTLVLASFATAQEVRVDYPDGAVVSPPQLLFPLYTIGGGGTVRYQTTCPGTFAGLPSTQMLVTGVGIQIGGQELYSQFEVRLGTSAFGSPAACWETNLPDQRMQKDLSGTVLPGGVANGAPVNEWVEWEIDHPFVFNPGDNVTLDIIASAATPDRWCLTGAGDAARVFLPFYAGEPCGAVDPDNGIKFRMIFEPIGFPTFGDGCPGDGGFVPELSGSGSSQLGSTANLDLSNASGGAPTVVLIGLSRSVSPFGPVPIPPRRWLQPAHVDRLQLPGRRRRRGSRSGNRNLRAAGAERPGASHGRAVLAVRAARHRVGRDRPVHVLERPVGGDSLMNRSHLRTLAAVCAIAIPACAQDTDAAPVEPLRPALMPEAIASFGAARDGHWLYVFGGHVGRAHAHSRDNVVGSFRRLNLLDGTSWEDLPDGPALQGTALVAHGGLLYRVGGMTAHNAPDEADDMHSVASVERFDPSSRSWSAVTPLPEPRSSHDACVVGDHLYVIGGWHLHGDDEGDWHDTAWVADLSAESIEWKALPTVPFNRRAVAVQALGSRVAVIGGMDEVDGAVEDVSIYDPATETWSNGPSVTGSGFGFAAVAHGDSIVGSGMDGRVVRLGPDAKSWEQVASLALPRFFHRLAVVGEDRLLAFGGAGRGGHMRSVEQLALDGSPLMQEWMVPVPSVRCAAAWPPVGTTTAVMISPASSCPRTALSGRVVWPSPAATTTAASNARRPVMS